MKKTMKKALGLILALVLVLGVFVPQTAYADEGKWIYVDGQNGNDSNDGSEGSPVQSWDKAKDLLGCDEGGIYVVGTVEASGEISTKNPEAQVVKRTSDIVMFNVASNAIFANINVDGEDKAYDSPAVNPAEGANLFFLAGAKFHSIGYVEDASVNGDITESRGLPDNEVGGMVCLLKKGVNILIDGAEFYDNSGKGVFFAPIKGFDAGPRNVTVIMKSGSATGNQGFFYHNEANFKDNTLIILNALIRGNNATNMAARYKSYGNRNGAVYVCDMGQIELRASEGAAIFENAAHDIIYIDGKPITGTDNVLFTSGSMLGGGNPNWQHSTVDDTVDVPGYGLVEKHYDVYDAMPTEGDKAAAVGAATSKIENNSSIVIDSNGFVAFGLGDEDIPVTPDVTPTKQGCDDTPTPKAEPKVTNTTAKVNDTEGAAELADGEEGTMTDVVEFEGLEDGKTYEVVSTVYKDGEEFDKATTEVTSADSSVTVTFEKKITEAGEYTIKTELLLEGKVVNAHNENFDVESEKVTVTVEEPPVEEPPVEEPPVEEPPVEEPPVEEPPVEEPPVEEPPVEEPPVEEPPVEEPPVEEPPVEEPPVEEPPVEEPPVEEPPVEEPPVEEPPVEEPPVEKPPVEEEKPEEPKNDNPPPQLPSTGNPETPQNDTPSTPAQPQNNTPKTGDENDAVLWILVGFGAALIATATRCYVKK